MNVMPLTLNPKFQTSLADCRVLLSIKFYSHKSDSFVSEVPYFFDQTPGLYMLFFAVGFSVATTCGRLYTFSVEDHRLS